MYRVIAKHTRPSTGVEFFNHKTSPLISPETGAYIRENYIITGKIVHSEESLSENGLELTVTSIYQDEATYNEWKNDSTIAEQFYAVSNSYREANGIISVIESAESV